MCFDFYGSSQFIQKFFSARNNLQGTLPSELAFITSLKFIDVNRNQILGNFPNDLNRLTKLEFLDFRYNNMTGSLPEWIGTKLTNLVMLAFSSNGFTGRIPDVYSQLVELKTFALDHNNLEGNLNVLNNLSKLEYVYLEHNLFDQTLTEDFLAESPHLHQLDLSHNYLQCALFPHHLLQHSNLEVLDLHNNDLSGPIPNVLEDNERLRYLALNNNAFSGPLSDTLGTHLKALKHLDVSGNQLMGALPNSLSWPPQLKSLSVGNNNWQGGPFPLWTLGMEHLTELSLRGTQRTGTLPGQIPEHIEFLDLSNNGFSGNISTAMVTAQSRLKHLMLQRNSLEGEIPSSLLNLDIPVMLLYGNSFAGSVCSTVAPATNGNENGGGLRGPIPLDSTTVATVNITKVYIADCDEVDCPCCTQCCRDDDPSSCSDDKQFYETIDGHRNIGYVHSIYSFAPQILLSGSTPISAKAKGT
mmetsp:Transcript_23871/g.34175  ORF Transcript_23871/g.34175 Transcript_23871/m.34175 type:complete len:470 (-) Transcript_23871:75-1484(-)